MSKNNDFDEIRQILLESSRQQKKTDAQIQELKDSQARTDAQILELKNSQDRTDAQILELKNSQDRTDAQILELKNSQDRTDAQILELKDSQARTDAQVQETSKTIKDIGKQLGGLGNHIGDSSEEFFFRSFEENPTLGNLLFDDVERWIKKTKKSREIDIVLINGTCIALIEVKFKADYRKLEEIKAQKTRDFRENHYIYRNHKLYFGIASMSTEPELIDAARKAKIFLLTQEGKHLLVVNDQAQPA